MDEVSKNIPGRWCDVYEDLEGCYSIVWRTMRGSECLSEGILSGRGRNKERVRTRSCTVRVLSLKPQERSTGKILEEAGQGL